MAFILMSLIRSSLLLALSVSMPAQAVVLFQIETFDSPTAWGAGSPHPSPPSIQADSGPLGTGDAALRITASPTGGPGSRLAALTTSLWTGDYLNAGVSVLTMDLRNQSVLNSSMRVAVDGPGGWFVTDAETLGSFSTWTSVAFEMTAGSLVSAGGSDASATLANVTQIRILHSTTASFKGGEGQRTVLVDNIRAVPEPKTLLLMMLGGLFLNRRSR